MRLLCQDRAAAPGPRSCPALLTPGPWRFRSPSQLIRTWSRTLGAAPRRAIAVAHTVIGRCTGSGRCDENMVARLLPRRTRRVAPLRRLRCVAVSKPVVSSRKLLDTLPEAPRSVGVRAYLPVAPLPTSVAASRNGGALAPAVANLAAGLPPSYRVAVGGTVEFYLPALSIAWFAARARRRWVRSGGAFSGTLNWSAEPPAVLAATCHARRGRSRRRAPG